MTKNIIITAILSFAVCGLILCVAPSGVAFLAAGTGIITALFFLTIAIKTIRSQFGSKMPWLYTISLSFAFLAIPLIFALFLHLQGKLSLILIIVMTSLSFTFFYLFSNIPLAVYHKFQEAKLQKLDRYPSLSILVPAYNEEKCIAATLETLIEADYPDKEIIVVDDGSTDQTFQIASRYVNQGIKVLRRPNGGKAMALNYGLLFAKGEIIVTVDADSLITKTALLELVQRFQDPTVVGVAGNVKVLNRTNLLTKLQALEYIFDINISRRALDIFGAIPVIPGCLGAFRRDALHSSGAWDSETVTEDYDVTVKASKTRAVTLNNGHLTTYPLAPDFTITLKQAKVGRVIQASSRALAYTEAPQSLGDLWRQRMRWYRGNFQTLFKHRDVFHNPRFGTLYSLAFPYVVISMIFIPIATIVIIISAVLAVLSGYTTQLLAIFGLFILLQFFICLLAIQLDEEDLKLSIYSPFFVIGYKHLLDLAKIKAGFDVLTKRQIGWQKVKRIGAYQKQIHT